MNNDDKLRKIADHYGMESEIDIMQEECAELVQAVSKYKRGKDDDFSHLLEEMADVMIMIEQVLYLIDNRMNAKGSSAYYAYFAFFDKKLDRQIKRIEDEG
jgi:NTP pyrophosphatase (non-canonical NTP hydrolase)